MDLNGAMIYSDINGNELISFDNTRLSSLYETVIPDGFEISGMVPYWL